MYRVIEGIAEQMQLPYTIGTYSKLNVELDRMRRAGQLPACVYIESTSGTIALDARREDMLRTEQVTVGFLQATTINEEPRVSVAKADTLVGYGMTLIAKLTEQGYNVESAGYQVMYDRFDATLIFVVFTLSVTPQQGVCLESIL